jgi:hypothetical protein
MARTSRPIPEDRFSRWILEFRDNLIIRSEQLEKAHPGKVADLSNCLSYLRTLLSPITTGNTEIQKE